MITSWIYETRPFMVSCKIKLQWNVLKIVIGVHFQSYKDYILPYISIKFCVVVAKSSSYAVVKTARKLQLDLQSLIEKKQYEWTDNGHWRSFTQTYSPQEDLLLCTGYFSPVFSKTSNIFSCVNVALIWKWPARVLKLFSSLLSSDEVFSSLSALLVTSNGCSDCHLLPIGLIFRHGCFVLAINSHS